MSAPENATAAEQHMPIVGYVTPLSGSAGQMLDFKISSRADQAFSAKLVRIDCADPNPAGPGMKLVPIPFAFDKTYPGRQQAVHAGSFARADLQLNATLARVGLEVTIKPSLQKPALQVLAALQSGASGWAIAVQDGALVVAIFTAGQVSVTHQTGIALPLHQWRRVRVAIDRQHTRLQMEVLHIKRGVFFVDKTCEITGLEVAPAQTGTRLMLAAYADPHPLFCFNGLIEAPVIAGATGSASDMHELFRWDLAADMQAASIPSNRTSCPLELINLPGRAMRSSAWTGEFMDWKQTPQHYGAICFHSDDLLDCGWQTALTLRIPDDLPSGVYGLQIDNGAGTDTIPFYVVPPPGVRTARILYLASTLTYQAYANHARNNFAGALQERIAQWEAYPHNPDVVTAYGASTYNRHVDGMGIHLSSRLRPILTMRPGYLTFADPRGSGLRHFAADSHLTDWLRAKDLPFDVITDEELDNRGIDALAGYDVVVTGSHPEYHTRRMLDALLAYRESGGSFMYMGGNGFYWKIARPASLPHVMEIRRAEGGIRAWASEPGEYYHQLDGGYGGMWRRNGLPPQVVGGVGFVVQGIFEGSYFKRTAESHDAEMAWLFDGVDEEKIGDYGLSGGGAAGFELDQTSAHLGTPDWLKVVAVSEGHGPSFMKSPEEILTWTLPAGAPQPYDGVCAHMVCGHSPQGGGLFASGSITFLGSLSHNGYRNGVSRIVENFLRKYVKAG